MFFCYIYIRYRWCKSPILDFVILFYLAASICGVLMNTQTGNIVSLFSICFQILIFYFFLKPIIEYGKRGKKHIFLDVDNNRFITLVYALIILQLYSIAFFIKYDISLLLRGDFSQIRAEMLTGGNSGTGSIFNTIACTGSFFYCYNILFFFYSLAFRYDSKKLLILLMISSTSRIFHSLTYMGRDGILFWILSFLFSYFLFKPYLREESKALVRNLFIVCGSFAIILIGAISISRFEGSDGGVIWSLINYFGQPIDNFGKMYTSSFSNYGGTIKLFPLLYGERGALGSEVLASADAFEAKYGFASNAFYSFVGSLYLAWGPYITLLFSIFYCIFFSIKFQRKTIRLSHLIILMVVAQIVLHNYFYWAYYIRVANLYLLTVPLFVMYCKKTNSVKQNK